MRKKVDLSQPATALFLNPGVDPGFELLSAPEFVWRERDATVIQGFAASAHAEIDEKIETFLGFTRRHKTFRKAIETNTVVAVLEDARFDRAGPTAKGRYLLNGAAGLRCLDRYRWANEIGGRQADRSIADHFELGRSERLTFDIPVADADLAEGLDFAIDCRNMRDDHQFVTEVLCQLCVLDDIVFNGRVFIHSAIGDEKAKASALTMIETLFPELRGRVVFAQPPREFDRVLTACNLGNAFFLYPKEAVGSVDDLAPSNMIWKAGKAERPAQTMLLMNAVDRNLMRLRERAMRAIEGKDFGHLPERFWVAGTGSTGPDAKAAGLGELAALLRLFHFEEVVFDELTALEKIAIMANAEMVISWQGAGLANMIFANSAAAILEIGTLQGAIFRWGDHWPLANAAMCRYICFLADYNKPDPQSDPSLATDGFVPVALSRRGLAVLMPFVVSMLGHVPTLARRADVARLVDQLNKVGRHDRAFAILQHHEPLVAGNFELARAKAECHKRRGEFDAELEVLMMAFDADPSHWYTLVQIAWCAKRTDATATLTWALRRLRSDFPNRFDRLVKERQWFLKYA